MIIALVGSERVGKDTFADILVEEYGFKKHSMADPIREIAQVIFPNWFSSYGDSKTEFGIDKDCVEPSSGICPRDFMKWLGTDIFQLEFHKRFPDVNIKPRSIWSTICADRIASSSSHDNWIIPDVRFKHEAADLAQLGCVFINLVPGDHNPLVVVSNQSSYDIPYILETYKHTKVVNDKTAGISELRGIIAKFMDSNK